MSERSAATPLRRARHARDPHPDGVILDPHRATPGPVDLFGNRAAQPAVTGPADALTGLLTTHLALEHAGLTEQSPWSSNTAMLRALRRAQAGASTAAAIPPPRGAGQPLDAGTLERMQRAFGHDFSHVRVHTDAAAQAHARDLAAHAFALGADLYFGTGEYQPGTPAGDRLVAHELTHVVQSDEGRVPHTGGHSMPLRPAGAGGLRQRRPRPGRDQRQRRRSSPP